MGCSVTLTGKDMRWVGGHLSEAAGSSSRSGTYLPAGRAVQQAPRSARPDLRSRGGIWPPSYAADMMSNPMQGMSSKMAVAITIMSVMLVLMIIGGVFYYMNHRKSGSSD